MQTAIVSQHPDVDETLRRYVLRRLSGAMNRLSRRVQTITVRLKKSKTLDASRQCVLEVQLEGQAPLVIETQGSNWLSTIDQAIESAARAVRRELKTTLQGVRTLHLLKGPYAS